MRHFLLLALLLLSFGLVPAFADDAMTSPTTGPSSPSMMESMMGMHHDMMIHFPHMATDENAETLFGGALTNGFYVAPEVKYARVRGADSALLGGRAAWLINHRVSIGGAGYMMANRVPAPREIQLKSQNRRYYSLGYGGLLLGCVVAPQKLIHAEASVLAGGGGFGVMHSHMNGGSYAQDDLAPARFFILEPEVHVELNLATYARIALGGGYRIVTGLNEIGLENRDLRGPSGSLLLKLGIL